MPKSDFSRIYHFFVFFSFIFVVGFLGYVVSQAGLGRMTLAVTTIPTPKPSGYLSPTPTSATIPKTAYYIGFTCTGSDESFVVSSSAGCRLVADWYEMAKKACKAFGFNGLSRYSFGYCNIPSPIRTP